MNASNIGEAASTPAVVRPSRRPGRDRPDDQGAQPGHAEAGGPPARHRGAVRHVGRKSGRRYVTPVGAGLTGGIMVIPLTFGNQSEWSRNIRAADGGSVRLNGVDYQVSKPELADWGQAAPFVRAAFTRSCGSGSGCWASGSSCCSRWTTAEGVIEVGAVVDPGEHSLRLGDERLARPSGAAVAYRLPTVLGTDGAGI